MQTYNEEKYCVMSVELPELMLPFDENGVITCPAVLTTVAQKAKAFTRYVHSRLHGSSVSAEIRFDPLTAVTINIYATPMPAYHARHPNAFGTSVANFPGSFAQDRAALTTLAARDAQEDANGSPSRKDIIARANLRKIVEDKEGAELSIKAGGEHPVNIQTVKPTATTTLNKEVEEISGGVRNVDSQDNRLRLFKLGPRQPNLTLFVNNKEDRERLLQAQLDGAAVTVKFRRQTNSMSASRAPRHGVLLEILGVEQSK